MIGEIIKYKTGVDDETLLDDEDFVTTERGNVINDNGVLEIEQNSTIILSKDIYHCYPAFNYQTAFNINGNFDIRVGLIGSQISQNYDCSFIIQTVGETTKLSIALCQKNGDVLITRSTRVINKRLQGDFRLNFIYRDNTFLISLQNEGICYNLSYKYKRFQGSQFHPVSRFGFVTGVCENNLRVSQFNVTIPLYKDSTVFIGDSITRGSRVIYPNLCFADMYRFGLLNSEKNKCFNFSAGSASSTEVKNCLYTIVNHIAPQKVIILIGDNDNYNDSTAFVSNITAIKDALENAGIDYLFFNMTPEQTNENYYILKNELENIIPSDKLIRSWEALARVDNTKLVNPDYVIDGVHLTHQGNLKMYELLSLHI